MRRPTVLVGLSGLLVGLLLGGTVASAATSNDTACRSYASGRNTASGVNSAEVEDYTACRFDKLDAAVKGLDVPTSSPSGTPTASPSPSASPTPSATPTPTPSPSATSASATPSPTPSPSASAGARPSSTNTGVPAGTTLTAYTGPLVITTAGTVIDGKDITGGLVINAANVVVKNSKIHGDGSEESVGIYTNNGSSTITDTEIYNFGTGLTYGNFTATRVNIHDVSYDGAKLSSNGTIQDSWIHDPKPTPDAHFDGIQVQNGVVNTSILRNNIDVSSADNAGTALFLCPDLGPSTNGPLTVTGNYLDGGQFTVAILDGNNGAYFIRDITFSSNRFGPNHAYGYVNRNVPVTQSGNVGSDGKSISI
jgi:hypothetical protein